MAGEKLTDIVKVVTDVAPDDLVYMVDVSDTTDDPAGSSAQSPVSSIAGKVLLQRITLSTAGEFDFQNIPQDYERLIIQGSCTSDAPVNVQNCRMYLNDDLADESYRGQVLDVSDTTVAGAIHNVPYIWYITGRSYPSYRAAVNATIENYSETGFNTAVMAGGLSRRGSSDMQMTFRGFVHLSANIVTRIRIRDNSHPAEGLIGTLSLYGER